ncbi:MAG: beta-CASP ribonuclease aCPSF1 [Candidatus Heimdallarchaeota archaeon]|nr:beta-CASP ribonuclease aCPSF1 [Candidatus Heimdallarchaeota archaeon]MCK4953814.1 beta-CASP ribonuclease aCPSF1 [Candidatus Heimdallarchaeota archaeon]
MSYKEVLEETSQKILAELPKNSEVSLIEFEGPEVAVYSKNPKVLVDDETIVKELAKKLRKRIVIRSDPGVRLAKDETIYIINELVGKEGEISKIDFDELVGEVIIEALKPGIIIGKSGEMLRTIISKTLWRPRVMRTPPIESRVIKTIRHLYQEHSKRRQQILRTIGKRIHRPIIFRDDTIRVTALGGFAEVGRSCALIQTGESKAIVDCGINVGSNSPNNTFPRFDLPEFDIDELDAVIISHAHLDHSGFIPYLFKYGYQGAVYATRPTRDLMTMLQIDYLDVAKKEGKMLPYEQKDIRESVLHTIVLDYGEVTDVSPDIRLTFHNAGHIVGSAIPHLHIGEGVYNLAFAQDIKFAKSNLLDAANNRFPRLETLFIESTYGKPQDILPPRQECEKLLRNIIYDTIKKGGKVLIPVLAVGRAQEILVVIENLMRKGELPNIPVYTDGMIREASAITTAHPEFLSKNLRERIFHAGQNPFLAEQIKQVASSEERELIIQGDPAIIVATSGMLNGGPSVLYFKELCSDPNNALVFVSYQGKGTLGSKIQKGITEIQMVEKRKTVMYHIEMAVHSMTGFTGHSDRRELENYIMRVTPKPEKIVVIHGEESKAVKFASWVYKTTKRETMAPPNGTTIRLR